MTALEVFGALGQRLLAGCISHEDEKGSDWGAARDADTPGRASWLDRADGQQRKPITIHLDGS
jgi:hypothetical protein